MAMLFISHDITTVRTISSRSLVLYNGRVMEVGPTEQVFAAPDHPSTRRLLEAFLPVDPERPRRPMHGTQQFGSDHTAGPSGGNARPNRPERQKRQRSEARRKRHNGTRQ